MKPGPKKGQLQKRTQDLLAKCEQFNVDIWEEMLKMLTDSSTEQKDRLALLKEMAQYLYPKRKAVEITADLNLDLARQAKEFEQLPREEQVLLLEAELTRLKDVTPK